MSAISAHTSPSKPGRQCKNRVFIERTPWVGHDTRGGNLEPANLSSYCVPSVLRSQAALTRRLRTLKDQVRRTRQAGLA
ncbi:hypothetical protein PSEUDO8Z_160043 [Pseudomonas sp. 8Z]|nr:hypothetical protein PSEUDO8Z_160043 [Pseudomonas sp. 8Z]